MGSEASYIAPLGLSLHVYEMEAAAVTTVKKRSLWETSGLSLQGARPIYRAHKTHLVNVSCFITEV